MTSTCELCSKRVSDKHYYSDSRCNDTGLGVVLCYDCALALENLPTDQFVQVIKHSRYHFKPLRRLHGTYTDPAEAEHMHDLLAARGRHPVTYQRTVRAEKMVARVYVIVADWANCCMEPNIRGGRCDNCGTWLE